ncbi:MAG: hypothetical protein GYA12_03630, partial [Chloroflexi bacterium]|nr:hypothetical protein [Chloroflexota bacterium]
RLFLQFPDGSGTYVDLLDISVAGCAVSPVEPINNPDGFCGEKMTLVFPDAYFSIPCVFLRSRSWGRKIILTFDGLSTSQYSTLVNFIFDRQMNGFGEFSKENIFTIMKTKVFR